MKRTVSLLSVVVLGTLLAAPSARGQWVQTNGPYGGNIVAMTTCGTNVFAGTSAGVFLSTNGGTDWTAKNSGLDGTARQIFALATKDSTLYLGTIGGIYISSDQGNHWLLRYPTSEIEGFSFADSNHLLAWSYGSVFLSRDGGVRWNRVYSGLLSGVSPATFEGNSIFLASMDSGVYRSSDLGQNWQAVNTGLPVANAPENSSLFGFEGDLFLGILGKGIFRSTDSGTTWSQSNHGLGNVGIPAFASQGQTLLLGGYDGAYLSTDSGNTWTSIGLTDTMITCLAITDSNYYAGTYWSGVAHATSLDGNWTISNTGMTASFVSSLCSIGSTLLAADYQQGVFLSQNDGASWAGTQTQAGATAFARLGTNVYAAFGYGLYVSMDSGATWSISDSGLGYYPYIPSLLVSESQIFAATDVSGIFDSNDSGKTWRPTRNGLPLDPTDTFYRPINGLASSGPELFAATYAGLYRSTNSGEIWSQFGFADTGVYAISAFGSRLLIDCGYGIFSSTNDGISWMPSSMPLVSGSFVPSVRNFLDTGIYLFAATLGKGVWLSMDSGLSWSMVNSGLEDSQIYSLAIQDSYLFTGTTGAGVWRRPLSDFGISSVSQKQRESAAAISVFPNPISQSTQIEYTAASSGYAEVRIVNQLGAEVARIFSGELSSGEHSFAWSNPTGLPAGMYECVVHLNGETRTLPIALTR